jgi:hypothetical protein
MPVKSFKFVSPGVFINEIDNSFRPRRPEAIGPVVVGRSVRGLAMQPVKLESFSDFLTMYGDTVPGNAGGDIYRDGNYQSPMYGTYAAKAFLNASVAPVTYVRLLGSQNDNATDAGKAGWQTTESPDAQTFASLTLSMHEPEAAGSAALVVTASGGDEVYRVSFNTDASTTTFTAGTPNSGNIDTDGSLAQQISDLVTLFDSIDNYNAQSASAGILIRSDVGLNHASFNIFTGSTTDTVMLTGSSVDGAGTLTDNGGAYGLWVFPSSSNDTADTGGSNTDDLGSAMLGAVWYMDEDSQIRLSGSLANSTVKAEGIGMVIESDASGLFTATVKGSKASSEADEKFAFNFNDSDQRFVRKVFNTNPQLVDGGTFYATELERNYWLGETFEQELREGQTGVGSLTGSGTGNSILSQKMFGVILPIKKGSESPATMRLGTQEAQTGWVIGQDIGDAASWVPEQAYKLFRLKGRGHGEWLHKNVKVSIEKIRYSNTQTSDFGTFSVVLRSLTDTDANPVVLERFDNLTLDPRSPNYISRKIGDQYYEWNETERRLRLYGEYANQSKFIYVSDINEGNIQNANSLVPFGYFGPPNFASVTNWSGSASDSAVSDSYIYTTGDFGAGVDGLLSGSTGNFTGSLLWPAVRLRHSASDGGLSDQTDSYFGMQTSRTVGGTRGDASVRDYHRLWIADGWGGSTAGLVAQEYIFTLDDVIATAAKAYYASGSRAAGTSKTATGDYKGLIDLGYDKFTMPLWGGFDGFDITKPDPMYNGGMTSATELTNYAYNTYKRAIDTVADPEFVDMNLLASPGLTNTGLTTHMVDVCEARADSLALIDLPDVYIPSHEAYYPDIKDRQGSAPSAAATSLRDRQIDSSYGATFYPWVQTVDEGTGQALWVPPTVAMMGVLASSERSSQIWFAPAGFNRGGLSDGAAGIPVTGVSRRLTSKERDVLYEARINPIASFPSTGIVVFGQKTLQERPSALDRINVRRLVIYLKKQISILSTQILFEQNVQATWNRFKGLIEPFLANVKTQFGITDYRLILDESTTTPDLVDQNVVYAKIMIKPARAIEYIAIDFIVASTGASFDD